MTTIKRMCLNSIAYLVWVGQKPIHPNYSTGSLRGISRETSIAKALKY